MKFRRKPTPPASEGAASPPSPPRDWTAALDSLTGSQVKTLLLVASESRLSPDAAPAERADEAAQLLAEMTGAAADSRSDLLDTAIDETTTVAELTRIKDLAKTLIKDAPDNARRETAQLLYHVSVAAAFVRLGASISGRPMRKQQILYEQYATRWAGHPIGRLFRSSP